MTNKHIEDDHQKMIFEWANLTKFTTPIGTREPIAGWFFCIPNGGKRNAREAGRLKKMGVTPGVPDMLLAIPIGKHCGLWIELKAPIVKGKTKPRTSPAQDTIIKRLRSARYAVVICWGYDEAIETIKNYLAGEF